MLLANSPPNKHIIRSNVTESSRCQLENDSPVPNRTRLGTLYEVVGEEAESPEGGPHVRAEAAGPDRGSANQLTYETARMGTGAEERQYRNTRIFFFFLFAI